MVNEFKHGIKQTLAYLGLLNPALGAKMGMEGKAELILAHKTPSLQIFVETGTEFGNLITKIGDNFETIYSIELSEDLYKRAEALFKEKKNIKLFLGDSATEIRNVLREVNSPALFWLDAHGPGPMTVQNPLHCPVEKELEAIFGHPVSGHVILIDDVRHFDRHTISVIRTLARAHGYTSVVEKGIFVLKPRSEARE